MVDPFPRIDVAVVTGAGSGIGRALAERLARDGVGRVIVVDRDRSAAEAVASRIGIAATARNVDVGDRRAVAELIADAERDHGAIDAWFSNAGINRGQGLGDLDDWRLSLDVNLLAHVHAANLLLPRMEDRKRGTFVITASAAGLLCDLRSATYTASKHAAVGFAEWLAISAPDGVSIHCVCPEGVTTGMTRADSDRAAAGIGFISPEEVAERVLAGIACGDFMIFTHPRTGEFEQRRVLDRPRWIAGMRRARRSTLDPAPPNPLPAGA